MIFRLKASFLNLFLFISYSYIKTSNIYEMHKKYIPLHFFTIGVGKSVITRFLFFVYSCRQSCIEVIFLRLKMLFLCKRVYHPLPVFIFFNRKENEAKENSPNTSVSRMSLPSRRAKPDLRV